MKLHFPPSRTKNHGMTFIEWVLLLFVVFILLAMLLPVTPRTGVPAMKVQARFEANDIATAITAYKQQYGRYPVSTNVEAAALARNRDFTCGGRELNSILGASANTPPNADVIAVLIDLTNFANGTPTVNSNHNLNPQRTIFLNPRLSGDTNSPGVGVDGVYRDPWGNPYIISLDLNGDNRCRDAFYKNHLVSRKNGAMGFDGLENFFDTNGNSDAFEYEGDVMVWSLGPDGKANVTEPSIAAPNQDNVVSWR
jgi:type II secretory pathway pseudopilin PulG